MIGGLKLKLLQDWLKMMRLQLISAKLKIVRLMLENGAIWGLIALFLANQIAPIVHDFKINIIKGLVINANHD